MRGTSFRGAAENRKWNHCKYFQPKFCRRFVEYLASLADLTPLPLALAHPLRHRARLSMKSSSASSGARSTRTPAARRPSSRRAARLRKSAWRWRRLPRRRAASGGRRASPSSAAPAPRRACRDRRSRCPPARGCGARRALRGARRACALQLRARALARHRVGRARREQRALPAAVARPAADAGAADAGARRDLAIGQRRLLDQAAHLGDLGVGVRPPRAARARRRRQPAGSSGWTRSRTMGESKDRGMDMENNPLMIAGGKGGA